ncbi:16S rRNA (uracil1498-N3)-methyltransferase [Arcticibacter pallidicorallinus]|uniref:Ribosomal RNA small subunit methyltransferase E n=1 Tax=Arcticibacter pallidicorallinus TaxID=1259464 RepID=A0A2T0TU06_9SPHI|nr:16S rRNA (uracil(1498)-N(3))-methyltransferase [Arcticibacter pallidicorallinus]PRY49149.1 16S rRNA (uracil1498-N3)-methyltransferase [Arcticibacter pallidicorallinus]
MHLFYTPDIAGDVYIMNPDESKHCVRVLRLQKDDIVQLIDGRGGIFEAVIVNPDAKRTELKVVRETREYQKRNHYLHIAIAPTKNIERLEWFLEKATEIGIDEISPVICDRSERKEVKTERLERVITSAVKQSLKAYHPKLNEPQKYRDFIKNISGDRYIAHCMDGEKVPLKDLITPSGHYTILIGPEGDFTSSELDSALNYGCQPITLGTSRLRTETAALEACFEINFLNR